jgi:hypothetical protein
MDRPQRLHTPRRPTTSAAAPSSPDGTYTLVVQQQQHTKYLDSQPSQPPSISTTLIFKHLPAFFMIIIDKGND